MDTFDIIFLGSGPGGYVGAIRAGQLGLKTAIIEKDLMGGTCLNVGCIPTKSLLRTAEVLTLAREGAQFGVLNENVRLDLAKAMSRKEEVVGGLRRGVESLMTKNKVTVYRGTGTIAGPGRVTVAGKDGQHELESKNVVIATGSAAKSLPNVTIDEKLILSSTGALAMADVPQTLAIIGAGAVGTEFASMFADFGSKIILIEALPQILPLEDKDTAAEVVRSFRNRGIRMIVGAKAGQIEQRDNQVALQVTASDGAAEEIVADRLLMAVGRRAVTEGVGLEAVGMRMERGYIVVDGLMRTSVPGFWGIGDCIVVEGLGAHLQLAHVASAEGTMVAEQVAGIQRQPFNYDAMPRATYCRPEVASVGLTEEQAVKAGHEVKVGKFPMRANSKATILGERVGVVKIVADARYGELLGIHIAGPVATDMIAEGVVSLRLESTAEELAHTVHPHPTVSEAIVEAAHALTGGTIHI